MYGKKAHLAGIVLSVLSFALVFAGIVSAKGSIENDKGVTESLSVSQDMARLSAENPTTISTGQVLSTAQAEKGDSDDASGFVSYSTDSSVESSETVETWVPRTEEEKRYYSYVGTEALKVKAEGSVGVKMANSVQGPLCQKAFEAVCGDYSIARTYNIFPGTSNLRSPVYELKDEVELTIEIPKSLQKDGRSFEMICVSAQGKPYVFKDLDDNSASVTIKTKYFYAYALCYKDN